LKKPELIALYESRFLNWFLILVLGLALFQPFCLPLLKSVVKAFPSKLINWLLQCAKDKNKRFKKSLFLMLFI
jgi:hypothetical protein